MTCMTLFNVSDLIIGFDMSSDSDWSTWEVIVTQYY